MCTVAPEKFVGFRPIAFFIMTVITQGRLGVATWFFIFIAEIAVWILMIVFFCCRFYRLGVNYKGIEGNSPFLYKGFVD